MKIKCPKCGSEHIDEFKNAFWYMCRDCGYNSVPNSDREKAISNFQRLYGPITDMEQLRATTIFTDEELEKLQNYIF